MKHQIYLDFNASTPLAPEVVTAMTPFLTVKYGNPSSIHWAGLPARDTVKMARSQVAALLSCDATEIVFTSGGTGSACHAGAHQMSPVLRAMGASDTVGLGAIRFSLGRSTRRDELDEVTTALRLAVKAAR